MSPTSDSGVIRRLSTLDRLWLRGRLWPSDGEETPAAEPLRDPAPKPAALAH